MPAWMIYGCYGYTGRLCVDEAVRRGMRPILAGRREAPTRELAEARGLEARAFDLEDPAAIAAELEGVDALLLCAGPFGATSAPALEACLRARTHYLDVTGEIPVFEACFRRDGDAQEAGVSVLPGVGFDVVPSDCLARTLAEALPGAANLELAFLAGGPPSGGTAKSALARAPEGGAVRRDGRIERVPLAWKTREVPFRIGPRRAVTIPWGDVSTAYHSTGIPNITVYMAAGRRAVRAMRAGRYLVPALRLAPVRRLAERMVEARVRGPEEEERREARSHLWGRVEREDGQGLEGTLVTPESYTLTARTAVDAAARTAAGEVAPGARTPSMAFGADYITRFEDCDLAVG